MKFPVEDFNRMLSHWVNTPANGYLGSRPGGRDAARALLDAKIKAPDLIRLLEMQLPAFRGCVADASAAISTETQALLMVALADGNKPWASFAI